jgi:hypothetical protein
MTMATTGLPTNTGNITFSCVVVVPNAAPVPQFRLRFTIGAVSRTIVVNGSPFTAELPPGAYTVSVTNLPEGYSVRSITDGTSDLLRQPVHIAPNTALRITVTLAGQ